MFRFANLIHNNYFIGENSMDYRKTMNNNREGKDLFEYCKGQCGYAPYCSECRRERKKGRQKFQGKTGGKTIAENEFYPSSEDSNVSIQ